MKCGRSRQSSISAVWCFTYSLCVLCVFFFCSFYFFASFTPKTKAFLSPNFYFRVHSTKMKREGRLETNGKVHKKKHKKNLFCHWVESPNVTYKKPVCLCKSKERKKIQIVTFQTIRIVSRMKKPWRKIKHLCIRFTVCELLLLLLVMVVVALWQENWEFAISHSPWETRTTNWER